MEKKKGLGKGLGAMFGDAALLDNDAPVQTLPISRVEPNSGQPRRNFDPEAITTLADSIRQYGLIQPLTVRMLQNGQYQIIAGERRWRAAREAGLTEVPVMVIQADDRKAMELALIENLQREDLNPLEEAQGYRSLIEEFGLSQEETAQRVGRSRPAITNALRLLNLPESLQKLVTAGTLSAGHARTLLPLKSESLMEKTAENVIKDQLSVRQTESLVKKLLEPEKEAPKEDPKEIDYVAEAARELTRHIGRKVTISRGKKKGSLSLEFYGDDDLQQLLTMLEGLK